MLGGQAPCGERVQAGEVGEREGFVDWGERWIWRGEGSEEQADMNG